MRYARRVLVNGRLISPLVRTHGQRYMYVDYGCRCAPCSDAHRAYDKAAKVERLARTAANGGIAPVAAHNASTYANWGCRCSECLDSWSEVSRKRRAARAALTPRVASSTGGAPDTFNQAVPGSIPGRPTEPRINDAEAWEELMNDTPAVVYVAMWADHHGDTAVHVFRHASAAIDWAKEKVRDCARYGEEDDPELDEELTEGMRGDGWLYYGRYSCDDRIWVMKKEVQ